MALNLGVAHGMPGLLATLSIAEGSGRHTPGGPEAIEWNAGWLLRNTVEDEYGPNWPAMVFEGGTSTRPYDRAAWCYAPVGVARALILASSIVGDRQLATAALELLTCSFAAADSPLARGGIGFLPWGQWDGVHPCGDHGRTR